MTVPGVVGASRLTGFTARAKSAAVAPLAALAVIATVASGCGPAGSPKGLHPRWTPTAVHLVAFDSCGQMLDQVRREALSEVGPWGLAAGVAGYGKLTYAVAGPVRGALEAPKAEASAGAAIPSAAGPASFGPSSQSPAGDQSSAANSQYSTTNNQEAGVDEPDLTKTDGRLLVVLRRNTDEVQVADVASAPPRLRGSLSLGDVVSATGLFLVGGNAVVIGSGPAPAPEPLSGYSSPSSSSTASGSTPSAPPAGSASAAGPAAGSASSAGSASGGLIVPVEQQSPTTVVVVVSLSDPDHPVVSRSFTLQGAEVDARLVAGTIEVVVASGPRLPFVAPADDSTQSQAAALAANNELIRSSTKANWLPSVTSEPGGTTRTAACTSAMHPDVASGLGTVSVVPIDPSASRPGTELTVVGDATTVYASATSLYVATTTWPQLQAEGVVGPEAGATAGAQAGPIAGPAAGPALPESQPATTDIHGFDLSNPAAPTYLGSGEVQGTLIGQYALSEYQGFLRVATTVGMAAPPAFEGAAPATPSDNRVTVLQPQNGSLVEVGSVIGLGTGEKIYAVRFLGPLGYVVTFRQTDPLYVLDLSDPHHPQSSGQLELTGYSSFLEPLPDGRVLGIGQDVNQSLRSDGLQLSLFDVSDPAHPSLVSKDVLSGAWSSAQSDPHALLWWAPAKLAVLPVTQQTLPEPLPLGAASPDSSTSPAGSPFDGAVAFRITDAAITEAGRVTQPSAQGTGGSVPVPGPVPGPRPVPVPGPTASAGAGGAVSNAPAARGGAIASPGIAYAGSSEIERSLVVGSMLYTVSETGILASDLSSFQPQVWLAYS